MYNQKQVRIVVPVYKSPSPSEEISFRQCLNVLANYPITLVCSDGFIVDDYQCIATEYGKILEVERFKPWFFENISGYNKLMLSLDFYVRFEQSKYVLIYQTDCFVFKDELAGWCAKGYDYIGAPWPFDTSVWIGNHYPWLVRKYYRTLGKHRVPHVGNGGLSLRKTASFIRNISLFQHWIKRWNYNEDTFISHCFPVFNPFFKIPSRDEASMFSVDVAPEVYFNHVNFPFGCHGWSRNDSDYEGNEAFYNPIINSYGYNVAT